MKAIIYTGVALFSAASVFGLADYYRSSKSGSLNNLYKEKDPQEKVYPIAPVMALIASENIAIATKKQEEKEAALKKAADSVIRKMELNMERKISLEDFSRGRIVRDIREVDIVPIDSVSTLQPGLTPDNVTDSTKN